MSGEALLDREPPRPITAVCSPTRLVALDCNVTGAERWNRDSREFHDAICDEVHDRVESIARDLTNG